MLVLGGIGAPGTGHLTFRMLTKPLLGSSQPQRLHLEPVPSDGASSEESCPYRCPVGAFPLQSQSPHALLAVSPEAACQAPGTCTSPGTLLSPISFWMVLSWLPSSWICFSSRVWECIPGSQGMTRKLSHTGEQYVVSINKIHGKNSGPSE